MKIIIEIKDDKFIRDIVPRLIQEKINDNVKRIVQLKQDIAMKQYLIEKFNINMFNLLMDVYNLLSIEKYGVNTYLVSINNLKIVTTNSLYTLSYDDVIRLIDNGNLEVKGLHIVDSAMKYIQRNIKKLYKLYVKGGLRYGD